MLLLGKSVVGLLFHILKVRSVTLKDMVMTWALLGALNLDCLGSFYEFIFFLMLPFDTINVGVEQQWVF